MMKKLEITSYNYNKNHHKDINRKKKDSGDGEENNHES